MKANDDLFALDSSFNFVLHSTSEEIFRISGQFFAEDGQRVVVGIEQGQGPTPDGFATSTAGFDFFYLVGTGSLETFDRHFSMAGPSQLRMFLRRWYTDSEILFSIDGQEFDDAVFVMGSCVSRDAFDYLDSPLSGYRARFSYASLHLPPIYHDKELLTVNSSPFQRRMVEGDLSRTNVRLAQLAAGPTILVDFIDERLPLIKTSRSAYTESPEFLKTGLERGQRSIDVFSETYFDEFERGWEYFISALHHKRILINRVLWATHSSDGSLLQDQKLIAQQNAKLERIYNIVDLRNADNVKLLAYPHSVLLADANHRWGLSPFHFTPDFYEAQARALQREIGSHHLQKQRTSRVK